MMKKRKIFAAALALLILLQLFAGCNVTDQAPSGEPSGDTSNFNAVFFDSAIDWIDEEFAQNSIVTLGFLGEPREYPSDRTFLVDTQEKYDQIFSKSINDLDIDFAEQMIVVYTFVDTSIRENKLADICLENGTLKIVYEDIPPYIPEPGVNYGDTCSPYQRWFVVTLDKVDVNSVIFEWKKSGV